MTHPDTRVATETLDPADWELTAEQAHRMLDDMLNHLRTIGERPPWQAMPPEHIERFQQPLPLQPQPLDDVYASFVEEVLQYPLGDAHPRFFAYVNGTGTVTGMLAQMLVAGMNSNTGGAYHAANYVEQQVLSWCKAWMGYPSEASGVLTSGGSVANLIGLGVARHVAARKLGVDLRRNGMQGLPGRLRVYISSETHSSIQRAVEIMGMGSESLCVLPADADFRLPVDALEQAIADDRAAGMIPFLVVGTAGTTNTGSVDPLDAIADVCSREGLWFHCDGAIGAVASLADPVRLLLKGMERADSLAFDMHKWLYVNYSVGCCLVRDAEAHRDTFSLTPSYLRRSTRGLSSGEIWFSDYSVELTREFRGLKVWMMLKEHGLEKFARVIQQNIELAAYLAGRVMASRVLQMLAPHPLHIVNFRYIASPDEAHNDAVNREIVMQLQERGIAVPTITTINGRASIRACINNHRTTQDDIDVFIDAVVSLGDSLTATVTA